MLKKTIEYDGFDGQTYKEEFCFHITEADIAEMELGATREGGFEALIRKIIDTTDGKKLVAIFKELILLSVGELAVDGKRFIKSDEIRDNFKNSNAYSKLFVELVTQTDKGVEFVNGIVPQAMRDERALTDVTKKVADRPTPVETVTPDVKDISPAPVAKEEKDDRPAWLREGRTPTSEELKGATPEQIQEAFRRKVAPSEDPETVAAN